MNTEDLNEYIKANSKAYDIFIEKARVYQNGKNANRKMDKRFSAEKVEKKAQTMWENIVVNLHDKLNAEKTLKKHPSTDWIKFMEEHEMLDNLEDSMGVLDLED
ncbi:hypothetical protein [Leuconostoc falkenbergense]|uniref:hypothetical protein n=1 Tax=Leuconostoc falkenbergense TaxID=2766470 RepID=UPI00293CB469|nr:hypothetical protein [Leuconostoc falkenbergense]MDV3544906.1 hypothetical protein [Leuconostoc falkenbergense]